MPRLQQSARRGVCVKAGPGSRGAAVEGSGPRESRTSDAEAEAGCGRAARLGGPRRPDSRASVSPNARRMLPAEIMKLLIAGLLANGSDAASLRALMAMYATGLAAAHLAAAGGPTAWRRFTAARVMLGRCPPSPLRHPGEGHCLIRRAVVSAFHAAPAAFFNRAV